VEEFSEQVRLVAELGERTAWIEGQDTVRPPVVEVPIVTFPEKLNVLVRTTLTGTLVWPMLKFTIEGKEMLKSPTETEAEAEWDVPPSDATPVIVTA
jgi:hypothetical protein